MIEKRLKLLRKEIHKNQKEFASLLGIKRAGYNLIENGKREMTMRVLYALEKATKCNIQWLLTGEGSMFITDRKVESTDEVHIIPIDGEIAAGEPDEIAGKRLDTYALDRALIPDVTEYLCLRVNGHSMEPSIIHQDLVLIKKNNDWKGKDRVMCAVRIDGKIALKRVIHSEKDQKMYLIADSKDYPPRSYDPEHSDVILIGTLQMVIRNVE